MKDCFFSFITANSSSAVHTVTCKKESLCQLAGIWERIHYHFLWEQKCKPKAALIKLLFEIPAPLTECTQSYTSRGFTPSWQSRTQLEEKVTLSTVVSVYKTLLTAHLQSWQELRVQFCGSLSASKPQLLWDYPQQCPVPVLVQPGSDGQGKHSLEKWTGQKCFGSLGNHTDANAQEEGEACNQQWGEAELWHPWISGSISIGIY